jgi:catechol 2,3-dioxygenase-like lactoylglutathione lyase family enzyme
LNIAGTIPVRVISTEGIYSQNEKLAVTADFVSGLFGEVLAEREPGRATDEDIIIYFDNNTPTHAGKFNKGRVVSKWGTGHLWEHPIYEVPLSYGNRIKFYLPVDRHDILKRFIRYAKAHGSTYED